MAGRFTEEQLAQAKETSLTELAEYYGFHPKRVGNRLYTLLEHDSVRIYNDRSWCRWSRAGIRGEGGGSQIDFLIQLCGVGSVAEAIHILLDFQGIDTGDHTWREKLDVAPARHQAAPVKDRERVEFVLPEPVDGKFRRAYAYLIQTRKLSQRVVDYFVRDLKILYEERKHHNLVFVGKDKEGNIRYATKRGTADVYGQNYCGDVAGNDKNYGINIINPASNRLRVFEASIDLMSYLDLTGDYESNKLVMGGVDDHPLARLLEDYPHIQEIGFCLDNDKAGMVAVYGKEEKNGRTEGLLRKYANQGYETFVEMVPRETGCKDWNEYLIYRKENARRAENYTGIKENPDEPEIQPRRVRGKSR